ncbi:M36 family metallopeptidase [Aureisphaera galaxeae]|uniref:M36 family metallopeptidase n=1 Tax=Aureisphaera galaxeae TaxID=1538023 RepID=UPI00234FC3C6|nr:M36 family metallopeptidase [Aureisphaera galaxeae]MDC8005194.1 M36 family metallopeptidase [Aureisphaera galaxeae]
MKKFTLPLLVGLLVLLSPKVHSQEVTKTINEQIHQLLESNELTTQDSQWVITDQHTSRTTGVHHVYYRQLLNGIEIYGSQSSVHIMPNGQLLKSNNKFIPNAANKAAGATSPSLTAAQAVQRAAGHFNYSISEGISVLESRAAGQELMLSTGGISLSPIPAKLVYQQNQNGDVVLAWDISIEEVAQENWWSVRVDATTGAVIDQVNWGTSCNFDHDHSVHEELNYHRNLYDIPNYDELMAKNKAAREANLSIDSYEVFAMPIESPYYGVRTIEVTPAHPTASPFGWHDTNGSPGAESTLTIGNNTDTYEDGDNAGYRADGGATLEFTGFPFDQNYSATNQYEDAALTNLFYWTNIIHDVLYLYGFDEPAGNFQDNNYGNGGIGNDWVRAEAQDGSGTCNANFFTPADGSLPRMQMYVCGDKDGDFDNLVIVHEYGHGISNRLTGGPGNSGCLSNTEQMGEGWSDWYGAVMTIEPGDTATDPRGVGTYLFDQGAGGPGIRPFPYSTDFAVNPQTYDDIKTATVPHGLGSVWCTMLWELTWELIGDHGWDPDIYNFTGDVNLDAGNVQTFALVTEAMKLQTCSPGFVDGRDAILAADVALYGGANECAIWDAFARRGLGVSAIQGSSSSRSDGTEAFDTPSGVASFTAPDDVCENEGVLTGLSGGTPSGGVYSGPGVTDDGNGSTYSFDPAAAGVGVHTITYDVPAGPCSVASSATDTIEVIGIPGAPATTGASDICIGDSVTVSATPNDPLNVIRWYDAEIGGNFLFEGEDYTFTPSGATSVWAQEQPPGPLSQLKISEITLETPDRFEIQNVGQAADYTGYSVAVSETPYSNINVVNPVVITLGAMGADSVEWWDDSSGSAQYWGSNLFWDNTGTGWIIILDDTGNVVDSVFWNFSAAEIATFNVNISGFNITAADLDWTGVGASLTQNCNDSFRRIGDDDDATNWADVCTTADYGTANADIDLGIDGCLGARGEAVITADAQAPTINCPGNISVSVDTGSCEATGVSLGSPITSDNCSGETTSNDAPSSFPVGDTTVTWTVTDAAGNTATCTQTVTVTEDEDPTISCPGNVTVGTDTGSCTASGVNLGTPTASDNCTGETVTNDAPSTFPIGDTTVTWTVTDAAGNTATCTQTVTVTDDEDPTIACPGDVTVSADAGSCEATGVSLGSPTTSDNCTGETTSNDAPSTFPVGDTTVTWTVTDAAGNTATCTQTVTVTDDEDPTVTCPADVTVTVNPGELYTLPDYTGSASATDNCTAAPALSQDPAAGTDVGVGTTVVTITATDDAGNTSTCTFDVVVDEVLGLNDTTLSNQLVLFPNPTSGELTLVNNSTEVLTSITITDVNGRTIQTIDMRNATTRINFSIDALAAGLYFARIDSENSSAVKQIIKR